MEKSSISWTDNTFNPWIGCTRVSPGCVHCYAEELMDKRYGRAKWGPGQTRVVTSKENWRKPVRWNKLAAAAGIRTKVFCASLADVRPLHVIAKDAAANEENATHTGTTARL